MSEEGGRDGKRVSERNEMVHVSSQFLGHGLTFAASTLLFLWLGHEADERLGTDPILALVGLLVGGAAGFWSLYAKVTAASAQDDAAERSDGEERDAGT